MTYSAETPADFIAGVEAYQPDPANLIDLRRRFIVPVVGPAAVGKTTLIDAAVQQQAADFGYAKSFTTRPKRPGESDDAYFFLPHTPETLDELQQKVQDRDLVQIAVHPTTHYIYGSTVESYSKTYSLIDMLYSGVAAIRRLPFAHCATVSVVATTAKWQTRFDERFVQPQERSARLLEAAASLRWSMADSYTNWLVNFKTPAASGRDLIDLATGDGWCAPDARKTGVLLQNHIIKQLGALTQAS